MSSIRIPELIQNDTLPPVNHFSRLLIGPGHPAWPVNHLRPRPRLDGAERYTGYVLPGVCLTLKMLRDHRGWQRYALYRLPFSLLLLLRLMVQMEDLVLANTTSSCASHENATTNANWTATADCRRRHVDDDQVIDLLTWTLVVAEGAILSVGLIGNILVIYVVARYARMKTATAQLLLRRKFLCTCDGISNVSVNSDILVSAS